jgi:hypothetical protein
MILTDILKKIFGKKKKAVKPTPPVVYTPPTDEIDPLTGEKRKKTVIVVKDTYEVDTMKLFDKLFYDFTSNNIQLSEVKAKYTQKVLDNLGATSYVRTMLLNLLTTNKIDIVDVDKAYLENEKNKSTFLGLKNANVNFNVQDKINFEDEISKTGLPILKIVTDIVNLYNTIDAKKYFDFKVKIKELYDKQLKYYRDTYGYLRQIKFNLVAPNILDKPVRESPNVGGTMEQGTNVGGATTTTRSEADLNTAPTQVGTVWPNWVNKDYLTSEYVIYNGLIYKNKERIYGNNNNTPDKDNRWDRV